MKLYIKIDYKDRYEISGTIKNKTRKVEEEIFLFYKATRIDFVLFRLDIYASSKGEHLIYTLDEHDRELVKEVCEKIYNDLKPHYGEEVSADVIERVLSNLQKEFEK